MRNEYLKISADTILKNLHMAMGEGEDIFIFYLGDRVQGKRLQNNAL